MGCSVCASEKGTPCGGCGAVAYCGRDCQRKDWKIHKTNCKPYKVTLSTEGLGRHMVASRDIKAGEVILRVPPAVVGPRLCYPQLCCVGCHFPIPHAVKTCEDCGLPVCGPKCSSTKVHQVECVMLRRQKREGDEKFDPEEFARPTYSLEIVTPLRIIDLRKTDPSGFERILTMESHIEEIKEQDKWESIEKLVVDPIDKLGLEGIDRATIETICGIIQTNTFEVITHKRNLMVGLYYEPSMMNHNCLSNTHLTQDDNNVLTIRSSRPIKRLTPIEFNYVKGLDTTWSRQLALLQNKYFNCACSRCLDPTELGSHVSSLRCSKGNCPGAVVPSEPLSMRKDWVCAACGNTVDAKDVVNLIKTFQQDFAETDKGSVVDVRNLLKKYASKMHKNHGMLCELKQILISGYGRMPGFEANDLKEADHKQKIIWCQEVLEVLEKVEPGLTLGRGLLMFELHTSLVMVANQAFEKNQHLDQLLSRLLEAEQLLLKAGQILKLEPPSSPYGLLSQTVASNLTDLQQYIENIKNMKQRSPTSM